MDDEEGYFEEDSQDPVLEDSQDPVLEDSQDPVPVDSQDLVPVDSQEPEPDTDQQDVDQDQLEKASTILEAMLTTMPVNRSTEAVRADIDSCNLECVLLLSTFFFDDPENSKIHDLPYRYSAWLQAFNDVQRVYNSIMKPGTSLKRTTSDPPEPEGSKPLFQSLRRLDPDMILDHQRQADL
jgi:hypothetical protein